MTADFIKKNAGFTLLETLLSIAIIGLIAGMGVPVYQSLQVRNDLDIGVTTIAQIARRAQLLAEASDGDSNWGVYISSGVIVLFKGINYVARDATYDEIFSLPTSITSSGTSEFVYEKFTGLPQITGSVILTSNTNETRTITINEKGTVSF
jgi:prepilin-type N-terminal cleavage/methylation domain-containing protein